MNLLQKNKNILDILFSGFTVQEGIQVKKNLESTLSLLKVPSQKILLMLQEQDFNIEQLLSHRCLPLIRFYLGGESLQKRYFLDIEQLSAFFYELPVVESFIFRKQIEAAQSKLKVPDQELQKLLLEEGFLTLGSAKALKPKQPTGRPDLQRTRALLAGQLDMEEPPYASRFYEIKEGCLCLVSAQMDYSPDMLLYSELSPLQQIKAQKMVKSPGKTVKL